MRIRKSTKEEVTTQVRLLVKYYAQDLNKYENIEDSESKRMSKNQIDRLRSLDKENKFFTITEKEKNVGYLWLVVRENNIFIPNIYILKAYRRKGFGEKAMKWIERYRKKVNAETIKLFVFSKNYAAIKLYEKSGFEEVRKVMKKT